MWWACVGVWGVDDFMPNVHTYVCCYGIDLSG